MTLVLRPITNADIGEVTLLARKALDTAGDLPLHVSVSKIFDSVKFFAEQGAGHFQMAAFQDGKPVAAVAAYAQAMPFHERNEAHVFMAFSTVPGAGSRLLRAMVAWFDADIMLRRLVWAMNGVFDDRMRLIARRLGFEQECPMFVRYKK
jgi:hypothetical protein